MGSTKKTRKTIGIDAEYVELLKDIASKRGMSTTSYLRKLLDEVVRVETMGLFAPRALSERRSEIVLHRFGFIFVPSEVLNTNISDEELYNRGVTIGRTLLELDMNPLEVIELIGLTNQLIIPQGDNLVILPQYSELKRKLSQMLIGIAKGAELGVVESGEIKIIIPRRGRVEPRLA